MLGKEKERKRELWRSRERQDVGRKRKVWVEERSRRGGTKRRERKRKRGRRRRRRRRRRRWWRPTSRWM